MYHSLSVLQLWNAWIGCFQLGEIMNEAIVQIHVGLYANINFHFIKYLGMGLLGRMVKMFYFFSFLSF